MTDEKLLQPESRCEVCTRRNESAISRRAFLRRAALLSAGGIGL